MCYSRRHPVHGALFLLHVYIVYTSYKGSGAGLVETPISERGSFYIPVCFQLRPPPRTTGFHVGYNVALADERNVYGMFLR